MHDVMKYCGDVAQPTWNPKCDGFDFTQSTVKQTDGVFLFDNVLSEADCARLIEQMNVQNLYPVGINGYSNTPDDAGSYRANSWATDFAASMRPAFDAMPRRFYGDGRNLKGRGDLVIGTPFYASAQYDLIGSTPWLRFMRYREGGMHVPHYDAPYHNKEEGYVSLFSWIIYLNDLPEADGGGFQFVDDGSRLHPQDRPSGAFDDWHNMADPSQITETIQPKRGRMLVFPHWLCHQVQQYTGKDARYIIRGDLAYAVR